MITIDIKSKALNFGQRTWSPSSAAGHMVIAKTWDVVEVKLVGPIFQPVYQQAYEDG